METCIREPATPEELVGLGRREVRRLCDPPLRVLLELPERSLGTLLLGLLELDPVLLDDGVEHDRDDVAVRAPDVGRPARLAEQGDDLLRRRSLGELERLFDL